MVGGLKVAADLHRAEVDLRPGVRSRTDLEHDSAHRAFLGAVVDHDHVEHRDAGPVACDR